MKKEEDAVEEVVREEVVNEPVPALKDEGDSLRMMMVRKNDRLHEAGSGKPGRRGTNCPCGTTAMLWCCR